MIHVERHDAVFVLRMDDGENRMDRAWVDAVNAALDGIAATPDPKALVTTGSGRFYSNGLDLEWLMGDGEDIREFAPDVERIFARLLGAPYVTVAACNGHTFAAGAMLAMTHDFRIMRADRGYYCLPEVDLKIPLTAGMNALMVAKLPTVAAHEVLVTGRRFGGEAAAAMGIVHEAVDEDDVLPKAIAIAGELAPKSSPTMGAIKQRLYAEAIELLGAVPGTARPD